MGPNFLDRLLKVEGDALIPEMPGDHAGETGFQDAGEDLGGDLHQLRVSSPQRSLTASAISTPMAPAPMMTARPTSPGRSYPGRPWRGGEGQRRS